MSTDSFSIPPGLTRENGRFRSAVVAERWFMLVLGALSVGLLGVVVGSYAVDANPVVVAVLATSGYIVGYLLARTHLPDLVAHLCTFLLGVFISLGRSIRSALPATARPEWQAVLDRYDALVRAFFSSAVSGIRFQPKSRCSVSD